MMEKRKDAKGIKKKVLAALMILLMSSSLCWGFDLFKLPALEKGRETGIYKAVGENVIGEAAVRLIYAGAVHFYLFSPLIKCTENLHDLILMNPELMVEDENGDYVGNKPIENLTNVFIVISIPFYVLASISMAVYLLFMSGSPLGRARAKSSLIRLVISMGIIFLTIPIMDLLLQISHDLTAYILNIADLGPGIEVLTSAISSIERLYFTVVFFNYWNSLYLMLFSGVMFASLYMIIAARYFMILYFTAFFPVIMLFFSFYFTRKVGANMFRGALAFIFIQPVMALMLVAISVSAYSMPLMSDNTLALCFGLAGFMALVISPLAVVKVMDWLAMLMVILTTIEFPGLHGVIGMIDELQIEGPKEEEATPPPPIRYR